MVALWVALGSALGGSIRFAMDRVGDHLVLASLPITTFLINISGSLLIGYLAGLWSGKGGTSPGKWHFWVTGVCGGYTTFSTFSWELIEGIEAGHAQLAGFYAAVSVALGLAAVWIGIFTARNRPGLD